MDFKWFVHFLGVNMTQTAHTHVAGDGGVLAGYSTPPATDAIGWNYRLVPSVASNNLTLAIKGMDGNDPSASNPVKFRIGNVERTLTAALSVTLAAGTGWMALDVRFAGIEVDLFAYIGYNATDGITLGLSRWGGARLYGDFNVTNTNEKYCAISNISNATAGDDYVNIGRFAATLSATPNFNWSVPTFTTKNLIHRQIFETRWLTWTPQYTGFSADPTMTCAYKLISDTVFFLLNGVTPGTSNATTYRVSAPLNNAEALYIANVLVWNNGAYEASGVLNITSPGGLFLLYRSAAAVWTGSGTKLAYTQGFFKLL